MLTRIQCRQLIFDIEPDFEDYWKQEVENIHNGNEPINFCGDMTYLSLYVNSSILENKKINLNSIFQLIEKFLTEGEQSIKNGAMTCFLEGLQNMETPPEKWVHLLGEKSKEYCQAWDEFTGVQTQLLWDNNF